MFKSGKWTLPLVLSSVFLHSNCEETYAEEDCTPCCSVCTYSGSFGGGGSWLNLRPLITPISYARKVEITNYQNLTGILIDSKDFCFDTEHDSGFELFAFYRSAPYCDDFKWDLKASFLSHRMEDDQRNTSTAPRFFQPTIGFIPQASVNSFSSVSTCVETDFELLNGEFGGVIDRDGSYFLRFFAGVQYASLKTNLSADFTQAFPPNAGFSANKTQMIELSRFNGIGPRVGMDARLPLFCGLSVI